MNGIRSLAVILVTSVMAVCPASSKQHDGSENECDSFANAASADLVLFLNRVKPDEKNGDCVTWAIKKLGGERYEPATNALVRLLDFRRPPTPREKQGIYLRMQGIWEIYPAAGALSSIGAKALPTVLDVIKSESASSVTRENAVFVWMAIYRHGDQHSKAVALLRQSEINAKDEAIKGQLHWAVQRALKWCNPAEEGSCRKAAAGGYSEN